MEDALATALRTFADNVKAKVQAAAVGESEAQLSGPVSTLIDSLGPIFNQQIVAKAESRTTDRLGIPDFGVVSGNALCGYVELKAPGEGANTARFKGRNKKQWDRFKAQPNILYTDGNEWCLYQNGESAERLLSFSGDITTLGAAGVSDADVEHFRDIITRLLSWQPIIPKSTKDQAELLAPLCRLLRDDVADALRDPASPLIKLATDWRKLLFPDADDAQFADSYAQTVTFALLLAHSESADVSDISTAVAKLEAGHSLLSRALQVLTDTDVRKEIEPSLRMLQRVINAFPKEAMVHDPEKGKDPWLYFYEHFLAEYDPKLRKDSGVYYTPIEVVQCQVSLVDELLRERLAKASGFAHPSVVTLDPAVGTGTYLLGVIDHALDSVKKSQGAGAVPAKASALAKNLHGFELMTGPYAVSELRITRALKDRGANLPDDGVGVYLADTLEDPFGKPPNLPAYLQPIAEQHTKALHVKDQRAVIVCIGNPPYDRHDGVEYVGKKVSISDRARTGSWVRWGKKGDPDKAILSAFTDPAKAAGHGGDLKNIYNLYVYFWRWAIWKVFQHESGKDEHNAGVVSFITASSYLRGDAFCGMRAMLRERCHDLYIIDLGGEGRGTRKDDNVFNIQTPVAICIALRDGKKNQNEPATAHYTSIRGTRKQKYDTLASINSLDDLVWKTCPHEWHAPLRPAGTGPYFQWPLLIDLMPWQSNGVQCKRTWPIGCCDELLTRRWQEMLMTGDRAKAFKVTEEKSYTREKDVQLIDKDWLERTKSISDLTRQAEVPPSIPYAYRSFDRQRLLADARLIARPRPPLWLAHSDKQVYLSTLSTNPLGHGPGITAAAEIPDLHHFRGSFGAKDVFPLYCDSAATEPNILPGFLTLWGKQLERTITPEDFAAYVYALLAHPAFCERFWDELEDRELRVPLTLDGALYEKAVALGSRLLFLHTYAERYVTGDRRRAVVPNGTARCTEPISDAPVDYPEKFEYLETAQKLNVGTGAIEGVSRDVWEYEVSGLQIVHSWLSYRMKKPKGKKSSPLDDIHPERWTSDFTDELLRLLAILEHSIALHPELEELLDAVCSGEQLLANALPAVPPALRKSPTKRVEVGLFDE